MRHALLAAALTLAAAPFAAAQDSTPDPFEGFGTREAVRKRIADAYRAEMNEDMSPGDLDAAADDALRHFDQSLKRLARDAAEDARNRRLAGEFPGGTFVLQVRSGAGGGNPNRISMNRRKSIYVDEISDQPLTLGGPVDMHEPSRAFTSGGYIPRGRILIITRIEYRGAAAGDSNGHGEMIVRAGPETIASARDNADGAADVWRGRLVVRAGEEDGVYVEVANSSECEAVVHGFVADPAWADPAWRETLTEDARSRFADLVRRLDDEDAAARTAAHRALLLSGPVLADYLRALDRTALPTETRARVEEILELYAPAFEAEKK